MVSKVVFVIILAVVSGTRRAKHTTSRKNDSDNIDDVDDQIHEAIGKLDLELEQSELFENEISARFDNSSKLIRVIHRAFGAQRIAAKVLRRIVMTFQSVIFAPLRRADALADKVETRVKSQIDKARRYIENLIRRANKRDYTAVECAVQSAEPFQRVAEQLYRNTKLCLTSRIEKIVDSEVNIVEQILLGVDIVTSADLTIANCLASLDDRPSSWNAVKASACLAKLGKNMGLVPVRLNREIVRMYTTVQTFNPMLTACAAMKGAIAGKDITVVAYNVGQCLMA